MRQRLGLLILIAFFLPPPALARKKAPEPLDLRSVTAPQDFETCFAPDEPCGAKLVKFLESARTSVDVAVYDINLDELVELLVQKSKQIQIRLVVDRHQARGSHSAVPRLIRDGVAVRYGHQRGLMHDKFMIIDGKMIETGSFNHTRHATHANEENQVYLSNPAVVDRFRKRFEKLWSKADAP